MIQFLVERELTGSNAAAAGGDTGGNPPVKDPRKKAVMQYLIDLLMREFNRILELQLGLSAAVQNDDQPHASSVDTDTSEPKAECAPPLITRSLSYSKTWNVILTSLLPMLTETYIMNFYKKLYHIWALYG
jgi:hypothetical protein